MRNGNFRFGAFLCLATLLVLLFYHETQDYTRGIQRSYHISLSELNRTQYIQKILHININNITSTNMSSIIMKSNHGGSEKKNHTEKPLIVWENIGRLGNHLFHYAAAYCLAEQTGHQATIPMTSPLVRLFPNITAKRVRPSASNHVQEIGAGIYTPNLEDKIRNKSNVKMNGYFQSWKYLQGCETKIRKKLTLDRQLTRTAKHTIENVIANVKNHSKDTVNATTVGVHVRRGDMTSAKEVDRGYTAAPVTYIVKAMDYYRKKYKNVLFIVCSDGIDWCKNNIQNKHLDTVFIQNNGYMIDFAILVSCSHSVITTGTFSWWTGWLAGGEVVYYKNYPRPGSSIAQLYKYEDYYPPNWIPMN